MNSYSKIIQIRWSDLDANHHLRHSAYYDFGVYVRMQFMGERGVNSRLFAEEQIGPVIFREEAVFKREIHLEDIITVNVEAIKASEDFSRWSLRHHFLKEDGTLAAVLTVDGAWLDLKARKLIVPTPKIKAVFDDFPKAAEFEVIELRKKE